MAVRSAWGDSIVRRQPGRLPRPAVATDSRTSRLMRRAAMNRYVVDASVAPPRRCRRCSWLPRGRARRLLSPFGIGPRLTWVRGHVPSGTPSAALLRRARSGCVGSKHIAIELSMDMKTVYSADSTVRTRETPIQDRRSCSIRCARRSRRTCSGASAIYRADAGCGGPRGDVVSVDRARADGFAPGWRLELLHRSPRRVLRRLSLPLRADSGAPDDDERADRHPGPRLGQGSHTRDRCGRAASRSTLTRVQSLHFTATRYSRVTLTICR